jgi:hypothetical protein
VTASLGGPADTDLRPTLPPARDQGQRGTCVAFAVTAAHEVSRSPAAVPEDLSEEALYWGCKRADGNWRAGTTFASASVAISRWGQPLEAEWPYEPRRVDGSVITAPARPGGKSWHRSGLRRIAVALSDLRAHLAAGTPVVLGLVVFETLFRPGTDGRVADPPAGANPRGRHAVLAVGHQPGELLIRNSWGVTWALAGYGWISDTYVASHVPDAWVVDPTPRKAGGSEGTRHSSHEQGTIYGTS